MLVDRLRRTEGGGPGGGPGGGATPLWLLWMMFQLVKVFWLQDRDCTTSRQSAAFVFVQHGGNNHSYFECIMVEAGAPIVKLVYNTH